MQCAPTISLIVRYHPSWEMLISVLFMRFCFVWGQFTGSVFPVFFLSTFEASIISAQQRKAFSLHACIGQKEQLYNFHFLNQRQIGCKNYYSHGPWILGVLFKFRSKANINSQMEWLSHGRAAKQIISSELLIEN